MRAGSPVSDGCCDIIVDTLRTAKNEVVPRSLGPNRNLAENVKEYDKEIRKATVYLFTRPVEGRNDEDDALRHWSLVFEFDDNSIRYVEGNEHESQQLMAFFFKESPRKNGRYKKLGDIMTSPAIVREIAVKNDLNYSEYCFAVNNCQEWVKQYAKQLNDDNILLNLKERSTLQEAWPGFARTASSSTRSLKWTSSSSTCLPSSSSS